MVGILVTSLVGEVVKVDEVVVARVVRGAALTHHFLFMGQLCVVVLLLWARARELRLLERLFDNYLFLRLFTLKGHHALNIVVALLLSARFHLLRWVRAVVCLLLS